MRANVASVGALASSFSSSSSWIVVKSRSGISCLVDRAWWTFLIAEVAVRVPTVGSEIAVVVEIAVFSRNAWGESWFA